MRIPPSLALLFILAPAVYPEPGAAQTIAPPGGASQAGASAPGVSPQGVSPQNALLPAKDAAALFERSVQLIESTSATVPGLVRAAAPVLENARQALTNLRNGPAGHAGLVYDLLVNVRAYLALADSLPKPYPFPEEGRRQFAELRDASERMEAHLRASLDQKERQLRSPDRDNLTRYSDADARLAKPGPGDKRIVFLGDSITDGWRLNEYFPNRDFINRGISGQITGEMLGRMKADVIDLKPAGVLILAGTNDIARGVPLSAIENNLTMIADLADAYRIKPMFSSVLPVSDYHKDVNPRYEMSKVRPPAEILELNRWLEAFCKQRRYPYIDYFSKMADASGSMRAELADDGLHPNSSGYRIMGPIALETIDRNIAHPAAPAPAAISSSTPATTPKKRVAKVRPPKPVSEPEPAPPAPVATAVKPAPAPVKTAERKPAKVVSKPAPAPVVQAPSDSHPAAAKPAAAKPAAKKDDATGAAAKKKKESFWKRTYPDTPPSH